MLMTSGLPESPAEAYLRSFTAPSTSLSASASPVAEEAEKQERIYYGPWCVLHEDVVPFQLSGPLWLGEGAVLSPPSLLAVALLRQDAVASKDLNAAVVESDSTHRVTLGRFTFVGARVVSEASRIESFVFVGDRAVLGEGCELLEGACVTAGSVVPAEALLAPYTVYDGVPAVPLGRLDSMSHRQVMKELLRRKRQP